jgi:hypothetical protein
MFLATPWAMKRRDLLIGGGAALALTACTTTTTVVAPPPSPDLEPFYEPLSPWGEWWWNEHHGWVWSPTVGAGWRPYTHGRWVWTVEYGWLWQSAEPFGWATFHYGRWVWLDDAGWVWVPGRVWGPAWVVWRQGPGVVGWAPLHPDVVWVPGRGFVVVDLELGVVPGAWVCVDERSVLAPDVVVVCWPPPRTVVVLPGTRVVHRHHDGPHDGPRTDGPDVDRIGRATGAPVRPHRVIHTDEAPRDERPATADSDDVVVVPRPRTVARPRDDEPDLYGPRARLERDVEDRPLPAPDDDAVERHWEDVRTRVRKTHEAERVAPPPGVRREDLERQQQQELDEVEREKAREKKTTAARKTTPRKVTKKQKPTSQRR